MSKADTEGELRDLGVERTKPVQTFDAPPGTPPPPPPPPPSDPEPIG